MKNKTENSLPKMMLGSVHAQYVRCGRASCKCARGELHGTYHYLFTRVNGKVTKRYLKADEVEQVRVACLAWREEEKARREKSRETWRHLREVNARLRDAVKQIKTSVGG